MGRKMTGLQKSQKWKTKHPHVASKTLIRKLDIKITGILNTNTRHGPEEEEEEEEANGAARRGLAR